MALRNNQTAVIFGLWKRINGLTEDDLFSLKNTACAFCVDLMHTFVNRTKRLPAASELCSFYRENAERLFELAAWYCITCERGEGRTKEKIIIKKRLKANKVMRCKEDALNEVKKLYRINDGWKIAAINWKCITSDEVRQLISSTTEESHTLDLYQLHVSVYKGNVVVKQHRCLFVNGCKIYDPGSKARLDKGSELGFIEFMKARVNSPSKVSVDRITFNKGRRLVRSSVKTTN